ncbi:alpha/beta fold hydrolase [Microbacterium sp. YY-01]|uniref:alpha/beta fold hydrolase n=1 Tax=Microbacterium sp. YY-01 TaxID=3421634 RepID=UPI003D174F56
MTSPYAPRLADTSVKQHQVSLSTGTTHYWEYGPADALTTIVVVHGFRGDHHGLEPVIAYAPDVRFIAPDLPGFGLSPPLRATPHTIDAYAQWLSEFTHAVAPGASVLGHSFGSIVASAALSGGLATSSLILVNPIGAPALEGPRGILTRAAVLYYALGARLPEKWGTALLRSPLIVRLMSTAMAKTKNRRLRRFIHEQHDRYFSLFADRTVLHEAFIASVSHDVREYAGAIAVPTLLIAAQNDDITPIHAVRELRQMFDQAELIEIAHVGHLIHYEAPAEAAAAIDRFIGSRDEQDPQVHPSGTE